MRVKAEEVGAEDGGVCDVRGVVEEEGAGLLWLVVCAGGWGGR